jgi:hypothetical protein
VQWKTRPFAESGKKVKVYEKSCHEEYVGHKGIKKTKQLNQTRKICPVGFRIHSSGATKTITINYPPIGETYTD